MKIDHELLTACVINPWSITPRMMLIDSMIESGWEEFKAMEAFEIPPTSQHLPSICGGCGGGLGSGGGISFGIGYGIGYRRRNGRNVNNGIGNGSGIGIS